MVMSVNDELRKTVMNRLAELGWTPIDIRLFSAVGTKEYKSNAGVKKMVAHFMSRDDGRNCALVDQCMSDGGNFPITDGVLIPADADTKQVEAFIAQFIGQVEMAIEGRDRRPTDDESGTESESTYAPR